MMSATQVGSIYWGLVRKLHGNKAIKKATERVQHMKWNEAGTDVVDDPDPTEYKGMKYRVSVTVERVK